MLRTPEARRYSGTFRSSGPWLADKLYYKIKLPDLFLLCKGPDIFQFYNGCDTNAQIELAIPARHRRIIAYVYLHSIWLFEL